MPGQCLDSSEPLLLCSADKSLPAHRVTVDTLAPRAACRYVTFSHRDSHQGPLASSPAAPPLTKMVVYHFSKSCTSEEIIQKVASAYHSPPLLDRYISICKHLLKCVFPETLQSPLLQEALRPPQTFLVLPHMQCHGAVA